jgi:hypothetical protein
MYSDNFSTTLFLQAKPSAEVGMWGSSHLLQYHPPHIGGKGSHCIVSRQSPTWSGRTKVVFRQLEVLLEATQVAASWTTTKRTLHSDDKDLEVLQSHGKNLTCQAYVSQDHSLSKSTCRASVLDGLTLGKSPLMFLALNLFRSRGWRGSLGLKSASRGLEFNSSQLHGGS